MKILAATRSKGKQAEVSALFEGTGIEVVFPDQAGIRESVAEAGLELHDSFRGNALAKAGYFAKKTGLPTVADDSGLEVFALGGEPGIKSKRWANALGGDREVDAANNTYLLRRLLGAPETRRKARYRCVLAFLKGPQALPEFFEGQCTGTILEEPVGTHGFGYDPLFRSDDLGKSFGEATAEEKHSVSHRGRAFRELIEHLGGALPARE